MFFAFDNTQYWIAPHLVLTKVYVNTFCEMITAPSSLRALTNMTVAILNSRIYLREKYLSGEPVTSSGFKTTSGLASTGTKSSNMIAFAAHVSVEVGPVGCCVRWLTVLILYQRVEKHDRDLDADSI